MPLRLVVFPVLKAASLACVGIADLAGSTAGAAAAVVTGPLAMVCGRDGARWVADGAALGSDGGALLGMLVSFPVFGAAGVGVRATAMLVDTAFLMLMFRWR